MDSTQNMSATKSPLYPYRRLMLFTNLFIGVLLLAEFYVSLDQPRKFILKDFFVSVNKSPGLFVFAILPLIFGFLYSLPAIFCIKNEPRRVFYRLVAICFVCLGLFFPALSVLFKDLSHPLFLTYSILSLLVDALVIGAVLMNRFRSISMLVYALLHGLMFSSIILAMIGMLGFAN